MEILVTGGTGFIGRRLCSEFADRGHDVTAFARSPGETNLPDDIATRQGDITNYDAMEAACADMDAVVNLVALSPLYRPKGGDRMHDIVHRGGTENAVRAAEAHDVDRFIQMSGIHADPDAPTAFLRAKGQAEQIVRGSTLDWTVLRPTVVFGDGGEFIPFIKKVAPPYLTPLPGGGRTRMQVIWLDDIAPIIADATESAEHINAVYELGGPDRLTLAEIARLVHRANGRSATVLPIPMALAGIGMTLGGKLPGFPFGPDQYRSLKMDLVVEDNDIDAFGVDPAELMTLRDYLTRK